MKTTFIAKSLLLTLASSSLLVAQQIPEERLSNLLSFYDSIESKQPTSAERAGLTPGREGIGGKLSYDLYSPTIPYAGFGGTFAPYYGGRIYNGTGLYSDPVGFGALGSGFSNPANQNYQFRTGQNLSTDPEGNVGGTIFRPFGNSVTSTYFGAGVPVATGGNAGFGPPIPAKIKTLSFEEKVEFAKQISSEVKQLDADLEKQRVELRTLMSTSSIDDPTVMSKQLGINLQEESLTDKVNSVMSAIDDYVTQNYQTSGNVYPTATPIFAPRPIVGESIWIDVR